MAFMQNTHVFVIDEILVLYFGIFVMKLSTMEPFLSVYLSFCPTDQKFASCSDDGTVRIWDFLRCHEERILRGKS